MHEDLRPFTRPCTYPYLHGVYLAANAIADLHLLVDAPQCAFSKAEQIFGTHDLLSTLVDASSLHRVVHTGLHVDNIVDGNHAAFVRVLGEMVRSPAVRAILLAAFPMATLIGSPYQSWCTEVADPERKLLGLVPGRSLEADWLRGYEDTLTLLAETLPLPSARPDPAKVAIVGYLMDRNEEDHRGNLRELARLLDALSLELGSVWLGGGAVAELGRVAEAGLILAFPHGRGAARLLGERTGATVLECELPFGPDATGRWLRQVAAAVGRVPAAERAIETALGECAPRLRWITLKRLVSTRWAFAGDPALMAGLCELAAFVGARVELLVSWSADPPSWSGPPDLDTLPTPCHERLFLGDLVDRHGEALSRVDLLIGPDALGEWGLPAEGSLVELGFSSRGYHALYDAPFLGYSGMLCLLGRMANELPDQDG